MRRILGAALLMLAACNTPDTTPGTTPGTATAPAPSEGAIDANVYKMPADDFPSIGPAQALVTIVFFADYQCPFCRRLEGELDKLRAEHPDDIRVVYAPRPLLMHPLAGPAARAALAAAAQGKFAQMHQRLLDSNLEEEAIVTAAKDLGLDITRFEEDRVKAKQTIIRSHELGKQFSIVGTPAVFVNGRRIAGAQRELVRQLVQDQLAMARTMVAKGTERTSVYQTIIANGIDKAGPDPSLKLLPGYNAAPR